MSVEAKAAKQVVIDEIKERFEGAASVVAVDYLGLTVEQADKLRSDLRNENVQFTVYKNTLIKRAIAGTDYEALGEGETLKGSTALAFCTEDATASARILSKAMKEFEKMAFKGGVVEGKVYDKSEIEEFATIPSREELIARFMGSLQSPLIKLALTLKALAEKAPAGDAPAEKPAETAEEAPAAAEAKAEEPAEAPAPAEEAAAPAEAEAAEEAPAEAPAEESAEAPAEA